MGASLAGDVQPLGLGPADEGHALLGGDVADVVAAARLPHQLQVPLDGPPLAFGADAPVTVGPGVDAVVDVAAMKQAVVLAVGHDEPAQLFGFQHGRPHHLSVLHALAVIGKGHHVRGHGIQVRQPLPFFALRNGAVGQDADHRVPADGIQLRLKVFHAVRHRVQVGHGAHRGIAAMGRRQRSGADGLLIRKTRLSEMYMHINETG